MPALPVPPAFAQALQHHQAGRLVEAETLYRQILATQPNHAAALHHLGIIAHQRGRHDLAVEWIHRAIILHPSEPAAHSNLGAALAANGQPTAAIAAYRQALQLAPNLPETHCNLGSVLAREGEFEEAIAHFRRALEARPDYPEACIHLGGAFKGRGELDQAEAAYRHALRLRPDSAEAHNNLGTTLARRGKFEEAAASYRRALQLRPDWPEPHYNLGNALREQGGPDEAAAAYRAALARKPDYPEAHGNLGVTLARQGRLDEAVAAYREALRLRPNDADAHNNLGNAFKDRGELDEAVDAFHRALALQPGRADLHSNLIYTLHFRPTENACMIAEEQSRWNRRFGDPVRRFARLHPNVPDSQRRLRIGYLSPEFRDHVTGRYLLPLFRHHDRQSHAILCYSGVLRPDSMTDEFRRHADAWRETAHLDDAAFADLIRRDAVDVLVDLTQHLTGNRLPVFAHRPAPVQVSFGGYPADTGVEAIPYRISDRYLESEIAVQRSKAEDSPVPADLPVAAVCDRRKLLPSANSEVYLIDSFWCYDPCGMDVQINALPALAHGHVTFGSLNNFCKVNDRVLRLWARVLAAVKESRLLLLSGLGSHRQRTLAAFERAGIAPHRVEFVEPCARQAYLELYHRLDIALDPFPYNGHTTSLDALWMGVPVVSLAGQPAVSRAGYSQLSNLGLPEWVAFSEDAYVEIAAKLSADMTRLGDLRRTLRTRLEASPLMDAPGFARQIEAAYRALWQRWCAQGGMLSDS